MKVAAVAVVGFASWVRTELSYFLCPQASWPSARRGLEAAAAGDVDGK